MITYRKAASDDLESIVSLLQACMLPVADVARHVNTFILAEEDGRTVGCIGVELYDKDGLLRSLAVTEAYRGQGIGDQLYFQLLHELKMRGVSQLHLLTTTAEKYFRKKGFLDGIRKESPASILATEEFTTLCPSSAKYMTKEI